MSSKDLYKVAEVAETIAERWVRNAEALLAKGSNPLKLSLYQQHQLAELAPLNRRGYTPSTWRRIHKLAVEHGKLLVASGHYPLTLAHFHKPAAPATTTPAPGPLLASLRRLTTIYSSKDRSTPSAIALADFADVEQLVAYVGWLEQEHAARVRELELEAAK